MDRDDKLFLLGILTGIVGNLFVEGLVGVGSLFKVDPSFEVLFYFYFGLLSISIIGIVGVFLFFLYIKGSKKSIKKRKPSEVKIKRDWFDYISLFASIATIFALVIAIYAVHVSLEQLESSYDIFSAQIELEGEHQLNEHISNIKSLEFELERNIEGMEVFVNLIDDYNMNDSLKIVTFHSEYVIENMKRSVADGKIGQHVLKKDLILAQFYITDLNNVMSNTVSPLLRNTTQRKSRWIEIRNEIINLNKPHLEKTLKLVKIYRNCLETEKNIDVCNSIEFVLEN